MCCLLVSFYFFKCPYRVSEILISADSAMSETLTFVHSNKRLFVCVYLDGWIYYCLSGFCHQFHQIPLVVIYTQPLNVWMNVQCNVTSEIFQPPQVLTNYASSLKNKWEGGTLRQEPISLFC